MHMYGMIVEDQVTAWLRNGASCGGEVCDLERETLAAFSNRITCTADHLPPRAAGIPRSSNPLQRLAVTQIE
jgi:hypothetical protein